MKRASVAEVAVTAWDEVCDASSEAWLFHRSQWIDLETTYHGCSNLSFALEDAGHVVAVQPTYISKIGAIGFEERVLHCGLHRPAGLAIRDDVSPATVKAARSHAANHLFEIAEEFDVDRIQILIPNLAPSARSNCEPIPFWVTQYGFHLGLMFGLGGMIPAPGSSTCAADQLVLLDCEESELFGRLDESCRRAVRKAERTGAQVIFSYDSNAVEDYYRIAQVSAERTGEALASISYYRDIYERFSGSKRMVFAFAMSSGGDPLAALTLLIDKGAVHFLAGVSRPEALPMRLNDLIHWRAILWSRQTGQSIYRLGPFFPSLPQEWPVSKVSRFKSKFGAKSVPSTYACYFRHPDKYLLSGLTALASLCGVKADPQNLERARSVLVSGPNGSIA